MNSSSSNFNKGFSTFHERNPILGFNSPPLSVAGGATTSGSYLSRPRLMKVRKQTSSYNHKFTSPLATCVAGADRVLAFNQFTTSSESALGNLSSGNVAKDSFLFSANRSNNCSSYWGSDRRVSNVYSIDDDNDILKLKINSDKGYANPTENNATFNFKNVVNKSMVEELPMELSKLKIEGTSNMGSQNNSQGMNPINDSQFTSFVNSNVAAEIQNELERMSLKDPADNSSGSDDLISDRMRELKVSEAGEASDSSIVFGIVMQNDVSQGTDMGGTKDRIEVDDTTSSSFASNYFQSFGTDSSLSRLDKMAEFGFTRKLDDIGAPHVEFKTSGMKNSLSFGLNRFEAKNESVIDTRSKKKKGKLKKPIVGSSRLREDFGFTGNSSENLDTFEAYSPMDISPYDEKLADDYSREISVTSDEASEINDQNNVLSESHIMTSKFTTEENLLDVVQCTDICDVNLKPSLARDEVFEPPINEVSETESFKSATENLECSSDTFVTALYSDESSTATLGREECAATFNFASKTDNSSKDNFTFAASSSSQCQLASGTRRNKKKQIIRDSFSSTSDAKHLLVSSSSMEYLQTLGNSSILFSGEGQKPVISKSANNLEPVDEQDFKHETVATLSSSKIAEEACQKWHLRGNQAYKNGDLAKAEDCYTLGLNSVSQNEKSRCCLRALMLCYSHRAATRISLGRMKEALGDCLMAATIDSNFLKVQVRAAHCYLAIGEIENAKQQYMKCLQSRNDSRMDRKAIEEASEGLEKTQKVIDCMKQCTDLFQRRGSEDLECALRAISKALQISTYSEKLLQMKADALFMLRRYEQVIQMCEQSLTSDEVDTPTSSSSKLWRSHLIVKSYFYLGRLDDALDYIKKLQKSGHVTERVGNTCQDYGIPLADTIQELLSHKTAGNEAYKLGKYAEAVEHYTAALSCNIESHLFAAICFCNRAAAYRSLGQNTEAIADCILAIALNPNYLKAISRRASLSEMIRDYGQAAIDLQRLVSLLTTQEEKGVLSGASDNLSHMHELKQTQLQISNVEEESRKGIPLNMYLIFGVESTASAADIKKAYRKSALRHHPDKAAQSLSRSDDGDEPLWKEINENVHKDADRLFKMIGEAYAVLSNPSKRSQYDQDEEMRNDVNRFTRSNSSRMAADVQNPVFEQSRSRHHWKDYSSRMAADVQNPVFEQSRSRRHWKDSWKSYGDAQYASYRYPRY